MTAQSKSNINSNPLIEAKAVSKSFKGHDAKDLLVLDQVNFEMKEGEIIALLGRSGSGKSTLMRIIAGLTAPTSGEILYQNKPVHSPVPGISMVFQSFALMPWLTVLQNVELGLEALGLPQKERRARAIKAIDIIGMDGFESAYPKELSGGMKQRVGFARALVVKPELLLMDEPFSALDVLTAENLRNDLMEIWKDPENNMKGMLFVTHNIEEAVLVADRIFVFASNPGYIKGEIKVNLPDERNTKDPEFEKLIDDIYTLMTSKQLDKRKTSKPKANIIGLDYRLPDVSVAELIGLLEEMFELQQRGAIDLPDLADQIRLDIDDLFPVLEALSTLGLAKVSEGDISMTQSGKNFLNADITDRKIMFAKLFIEQIPIAHHIVQALDNKSSSRVPEDKFLKILEPYFSEEESERILSTVIDWGRYAEAFAYDYNTGMFSLEDVK